MLIHSSQACDEEPCGLVARRQRLHEGAVAGVAQVGVAGPQIVAFVKDNVAIGKQSACIFGIASALLAIGFLISLCLGTSRFSGKKD